MFTAALDSAPARAREGLRSHILLQAGDIEGASLSVTWVDVAPGGRQRPHSHDPEQVYVIVAGRGRMRVGGEARELERGELVFIPPGTVHSIENIGAGTLTYVSAATPADDVAAAYDSGQLAETQRG